MSTQKLLEDLTNVNGISGFEKEVVALSASYLKSDALTLVKGGLNNLYIKRRCDEGVDKPTLLLDAHTDELGFMVQSITAKGLIRVVPIGGWDPRNISAHKVRIQTENGWIKGVFASKPPHFMTEQEKKLPLSMDQLLIDVGASSYNEAKEQYGVTLGAPIVPDVISEWLSPEVLLAKALDNRLGCALVLQMMEHFAEADLPFKLVGALSSQEEVGARGARITAHDIQPDLGIIFEGTPADDSFTDALEIQGGLGLGPQIRHRDNQMISSPTFTALAIKVAKDKGIPHQEAVRQGGSTNAAVYHAANQGAPCIVIGVPVRYAHTHYGLSSLKDYSHAFDWGKSVVEALSLEAIQSF